MPDIDVYSSPLLRIGLVVVSLVRCCDAYPPGRTHEQPDTLMCAEYGDIVASGRGEVIVKRRSYQYTRYVIYREGGWGGGERWQ